MRARDAQLLEREDALAALRDAAADAAAGEGRLVLVTGDAGIGKTALARSFLDGLPAGTRVLEGACDALVTPWRRLRPPRRRSTIRSWRSQREQETSSSGRTCWARSTTPA